MTVAASRPNPGADDRGGACSRGRMGDGGDSMSGMRRGDGAHGPRARTGPLILVGAALLGAGLMASARGIPGSPWGHPAVAGHDHVASASALAVPPPGPSPEGMVWIPGGTFRRGSEDESDARPVREVEVDGFWMDRTEVTNAEFAAFVRDTGYVTVAERSPDPDLFPGAPRELLVPGSIVFAPPSGAVDLTQPLSWWRYRPGSRGKGAPDSGAYHIGFRCVLSPAARQVAAQRVATPPPGPGTLKWCCEPTSRLSRLAAAEGPTHTPAGDPGSSRTAQRSR